MHMDQTKDELESVYTKYKSKDLHQISIVNSIKYLLFRSINKYT